MIEIRIVQLSVMLGELKDIFKIQSALECIRMLKQ